MDKDLENLLLQAKQEIIQLRHHNEIMSAKLDGIDVAMTLLHSAPASKGGMGMGEDIAWKIDKYITEKGTK